MTQRCLLRPASERPSPSHRPPSDTPNAPKSLGRVETIDARFSIALPPNLPPGNWLSSIRPIGAAISQHPVIRFSENLQVPFARIA